MKKRFLSALMAAVLFIISMGMVRVSASDESSESLKKIEPYALSGYYNKQLNNSWAEVSLSDKTDANGVITTTASYSGTIASDKRIATFQPWEKGQGTRENAAGAYTLYYGVTVKEVTSPVSLAYKYDQGGIKYLLSLSNSKVVAGGSMSGSDYINVTAPYTIDIFMNIQSGNGYIYVNGQLLYEGGMTNSSGDKKWHEVRVFSLEGSTGIRFVTTAARSSVFTDDITIQDVIKAYIGDGAISGDDETKVNIPKALKALEPYALPGYFYKQINNHWAEITLSDETDQNGIITTTATYEGTLEAGKRVAVFQPWDKNKPTLTKAEGAYTMHCGFTVNEITSPVCLEYRYDASKKLISFSDSRVVWGDNMYGETYIEVTAPYTIDIFMNIQNAKGIIYVNGQVLYDGTIRDSNFCNSSADTKWTEIRVRNLENATDFKMVTTAANGSVYNDGITLREVVKAYSEIDPNDIIKPEEPPLEYPEDCTKVTVGDVTARVGGEVTVPVSISDNNIGLCGLTLNFTYDKNVFSYVDAVRGDAIPTMDLTKPGSLYEEGDLTFNWDSMDSDFSNGEILFITFRVSEDAPADEYAINLIVKEACDFDMEDVLVNPISGKVEVTQYTLGDTNGDGEISVKDVVPIRRFIAGGYGVDVFIKTADVNGDGEISVKDVVPIRRFIAGGYGVEL